MSVNTQNRSLRRVQIAGLGKYLPERRVTSAELEERLGLKPGWIEHKTGVHERRYVGDETQSQMGAVAAQRALQDAGRTLKDVDLLISASGSVEQAIPCTAVLIQRALGEEAWGIPCFDVNATCLSFVAALDVAANFVATRSHRSVLVVSAELASVGINWKEPESSVLMGDGAAAVLLTASAENEPSGMFTAMFATYSEGADYARLQGCGTRFHPSRGIDNPDVNLFHMDGPRVFRFAQRVSAPAVRRYVQELSWESNIDAVVPHQASLFAVRMTAKACGLPMDRLVENIQTHGNCVAASIPMALHDAVRDGRIRRGHNVLLAGTAAGVSVGAIGLRY